MIDWDVVRRADLKSAEPGASGLTPAGLERLSAALEAQVEAGKIPGASALIFRNGVVGYARHFGFARPDGTALKADTIFRIYSMTKPVVSVAAIQLVEEGRLLLSDPVAKFIPAFADVKVGVERDGELDLVAPRRPMTIQDLLRHTSGLTYGFTGVSKVQRLYHNAAPLLREGTTEEMVNALAGLPLRWHPGEAWEYGHSTEVLGRVLEVIDGAKLGEVLKGRIFDPLGMTDTAFFTPSESLARRAEPISFATFEKLRIPPINYIAPPPQEAGGGGLVSTLPDYARFCAMLLEGGAFGEARILSPRTLAFMTADHLGPGIGREHFLLAPGYGFGLGFAVRTALGQATTLGSVGEYNWGGAAGTAFWVSPADRLFSILMIQTADHGDTIRPLFRNLVYAALA